MFNLRASNHGRTFPPEISLRDLEAKRGTQVLMKVDKELVVGLNVRRGVYEIWGPSISAGGWVHLLDVMDDKGQPFHPPHIPWKQIAATIQQARDDDQNVADQVWARNAARRLRERAEISTLQKEYTKYAQRNMAQEWDGVSRHSARDVMLGLRSARTGQTQDPEPVKTTFAPGVQPETGGVPEKPKDGFEEMG